MSARRRRKVTSIAWRGKTNRGIASELFIAAGTVKAHTASTYCKLDVRNRTEAVTRARELKLVNGVHT
ncbi:MAG: response regulator transcription factor [Anaerolineae bacterium]|nr:response regulator transcription factor [Anaerolineae bacterium]